MDRTQGNGTGIAMLENLTELTVFTDLDLIKGQVT